MEALRKAIDESLAVILPLIQITAQEAKTSKPFAMTAPKRGRIGIELNCNLIQQRIKKSADCWRPPSCRENERPGLGYDALWRSPGRVSEAIGQSHSAMGRPVYGQCPPNGAVRQRETVKS